MSRLRDIVASQASRLRGVRTEAATRFARSAVNAVVSIVVFAAILIVLQILASRHGASLDTTANKRFSLSSQTVKILDRLEKEVVFTCFFQADAPARKATSDLLDAYVGENRRVRYSFVDPDKDPISAKRYRIRKYGTIVVESNGNEERLSQITEEKFTNAILKVTRDAKKIICCLTGHGEKSIEDADPGGLRDLKRSMEGESYSVIDVLTLRDSIPPDCAVLIIPGPEKDLHASEKTLIERYLDGGGSILMLIDPFTDLPLFESIASDFGIEITRSIIVDRIAGLLSGNIFTPAVNQYGAHTVTEGFRLASFFPQARALRAASEKPAGIDIAVLASTGASAFGETNLDDALEGKTSYESDRDLAGPLDMALLAKKSLTAEPERDTEAGSAQQRSARVIVFGDSDFASNAHIALWGNRDLVLNSIGWLAEEEDLIAVRAKNPVSQPVVLTVRQGRTVFWFPVVVLPAVVACVGVLVLVRRRRSA